MTFWEFSDLVVAGVKEHVALPGNWPYGVFGKDPTEALIQYGAACAVMSVDFHDDRASNIVVWLPGNQELNFHVWMNADEAQRIGDEIGRLFSQIG